LQVSRRLVLRLSGHQHDSPEDITAPNAVKRLIGLLERQRLDVPPKLSPRREFDDGCMSASEPQIDVVKTAS
jgi:hypothetical protein